MSTGQAESGAGDAPPSVSEVCSEEDYEPSSSRPTTHNGGRDCMLMGSRECNEYVSEFLSTIDYVFIRPISIARFLLTVCKLRGMIPLAPACTRVTNKHIPALKPYWL